MKQQRKLRRSQTVTALPKRSAVHRPSPLALSVLDALGDILAAHPRYSASQQEIADRVGRKPGTIGYHLSSLERAGLIHRLPQAHRCIELTAEGYALYAAREVKEVKGGAA